MPPKKSPPPKKPAPKKPAPKKPTPKKTKPIEKPAEESVTIRPKIGNVTYHLTPEAHNAPSDIKAQIQAGMDAACLTYSQYTPLVADIKVHYDPTVPTAHVDWTRMLTFGNMFGYRTSLHEIAHAVGVGTDGRWTSYVNEGRWTGARATGVLRDIDGPDAVLYADSIHFWPYGLNYENELTRDADTRHARIVYAMITDMNS
jgi:hypothetical protein